MYTTREDETGHVSCFVSGLLFNVVPDSKRILSCAISAVRANNPLNESNEELRFKQWCSNFKSSFPYFKNYAINAEMELELLPFIFERPKIKRTLSSTGKRQTTLIQVAAGKPG